nr:alpha/beta fold hydrolase [Amycolatopsis arida]
MCNERHRSGPPAGERASGSELGNGSPPVTRSEVSFDSAGQRCDAWLYRPAGPGPVPCVVMAHEFGGSRSARLDAFAERFSRAGLAVLVFDYRHLGTSEGQPRGLIDIDRQRDDYRAAVTYARGLRGIDAGGIALWGTSFSSGHVLTLAAEDSEIAAGVIQNPYVDGPAGVRKSRASAGLRTSRALARAWIRDELRNLRGREPHRVKLVGEPGSVAIWTTPDALAGYESILPADRAGWEPAVPARILLRTVFDRPIRGIRAITCPLLVCVCDRDRIAPVRPAIRVARHAPRGELRRYPLGHFDVFTGDGFDQVVSDQTAFLRRVLHTQP